MPRKKKKRKNTSLQKTLFLKHAREQQALFFEKLDAIARVLGLGNIAEEIPETEKMMLYNARYHPPKVQKLDKSPVFNSLVRRIQTAINEFLLEYHFHFPNTKQEFPFIDYFTVVLSIRQWLTVMAEVREDFSGYERFKKAFKPLLDYCKADENPEKDLADYCDMLGYSLTIPEKSVYFIYTGVTSRTSPRIYIAVTVTVGVAFPETKRVKFDGHSRKVYMLLYLKNRPHIAKVRAGDLQARCAVPDMELNVYFQKHAMERLKERIDCFEFRLVLHGLGESFEKPEVIPDPVYKMRVLLTYRFFGQKLGYFLVEVKDGIAVIRTFLFLTNDSTPEGRKLKRHLAISKLDKVYNKLDKLSTFVMSDLVKDKELRGVLKACGCGSLFEIPPGLVEAARLDGIEKETPSVKTIRKYLMLVKK